MNCKKIKTLEELRQIRQQLKEEGKIVVWTNGCFDLLHIGHIKCLQKAKEKGDILIIGINSDNSVKTLKGDKRPLVPEQERAELVASLECVDYIIIFNDKTVERMLTELKPDIFIKGGDYTIDTINQDERKIVEDYGGKVIIIPPVEGYSTTNIINKILENYK